MDIERADSAEALEDLEHALVVAVKSGDRTATKEILKILLPESQTEVRAPVSRILWRAVLEEEDKGNVASPDGVNGAAKPAEEAIPLSLLDFGFVDDINGRTSLHEVNLTSRCRCLTEELTLLHRPPVLVVSRSWLRASRRESQSLKPTSMVASHCITPRSTATPKSVASFSHPPPTPPCST